MAEPTKPAAAERGKRPRRFRLRIEKLLALVTGALLAAGFLWSQRPGRPPQAAVASPAPRKAQVIRARKLEIPVEVQAPGTVRPRVRAEIAPRIQARIEELKKQPGDEVRSGEVLALLDRRDLEAQVEAAQARLRAAEESLGGARAEAERVRGLHAREAATQRDLDLATFRLGEVTAERDAAARTLDEVRVRLADATIVSPLDGVVGEKLAERGDLASPGKPLLVLHDPARLRLEVAVEERLLLELKRGDLLAVSLEALGTEQRSPVDEIVPAVDPLTRTGLVKIDLPRLPGARPGTFGRARIPAGRRPAIVVPRSAVLRRGQLEIVFTVERSPDGTPRARLVLVRAGEEVSIAGAEPSVEILSGLEAGTLLVAREVEDLRDGAPLEVGELPEPDAPAGDAGAPSPASPGRPAKESGRP